MWSLGQEGKQPKTACPRERWRGKAYCSRAQAANSSSERENSTSWSHQPHLWLAQGQAGSWSVPGEGGTINQNLLTRDGKAVCFLDLHHLTLETVATKEHKASSLWLLWSGGDTRAPGGFPRLLVTSHCGLVF